MRLIDADALHEKANGLNWKERSVIQHALRVSPTIEAKPVRHGRWVNEGVYVTTAYGSLDVYRCSVCDQEITIDDFDNYCPNCGAKMDGE